MSIAPEYNLGSFTCPYCNVLAQHFWYQVRHATKLPENSAIKIDDDYIKISKCSACGNDSIWINKKRY